MDNQIQDLPRFSATTNLPTVGEYRANHVHQRVKGLRYLSECGICYVQFGKRDRANADLVVILDPCRHEFHQACFDGWVGSADNERNKCTVCGKELFALPILTPLQAAQMRAQEEKDGRRTRGAFNVQLFRWVLEQTDRAFKREKKSTRDIYKIESEILGRFHDENAGEFVSTSHEYRGDLFLIDAIGTRVHDLLRQLEYEDSNSTASDDSDNDAQDHTVADICTRSATLTISDQQDSLMVNT
jgi:hypothetical protein